MKKHIEHVDTNHFVSFRGVLSLSEDKEAL